MPRIPDQLFQSVVYLYPSEAAAVTGEDAGGTGFFVESPSSVSGLTFRYVVSNVHVVFSGNTTLRINKTGGGVETLVLPEASWVQHPDGDDVAVAPVASMPPDWRVMALGLPDFYPTPERMEELNVGVGDDVFMLGRFFAHSGRQRNEPLARFGNIAMMPGEKVLDGRQLLVDAFLVEMHSLPGFSGSPVFIAIGAGSYRGVYGADKQARMMPFYTETIGLLGIDTGHKQMSHKVIDRTTREPVDEDWRVQQNSAVAIVAPYNKIGDVMSSEELVEQREYTDKEWLDEHEHGPAARDSGEERDEWGRSDFLGDLRRLTGPEPSRQREQGSS
jgi:hypothetical protein